MSGTLKLFCWIIGTSTEQIFQVRVGHEDVWADAKKAIKVENKIEFSDIAADTLDLWKVTIDRSKLSTLESEDYLKNVMATNPLHPIGSLATVRNDPLPDGHINIIIVQRPTYIKGSIVEELELLRRHFWGQNRATLNLAAETIDLSSVNYSRINPLSFKILLVRKEYHVAYDALIASATIKAARRAIYLMTGQPGIGSVKPFSYYTSFSVNSKSGKLSPFISVPKNLSSSTSPAPPSSSQRQWMKQLLAEMYVMDIWPPEEVRMLLTVSGLDSARGLTLFNLYGSNIRVIFDILDDPTKEVIYVEQIEVAAASVAQEFPAAFQELLGLGCSATEVASMIFTLRPRDSILRNQTALTIQTKFLLKTLALALSSSAEAQKNAAFTLLNTHPTLRAPAGWMFENMAHVIVGDAKRTRLKIYDGRNREFFMPAPEEMISGNTALRGLRKQFRSFYWRPRESNYDSGVDSVLRCGNNVWALQYTVSRPHRAATKGLTEVRNNMNHISKVKWHLVMIGATLSEAESARDSQKLTDQWDGIPVYACVVQLGAFDQSKFQQLRDVLDDDVVVHDC